MDVKYIFIFLFSIYFLFVEATSDGTDMEEECNADFPLSLLSNNLIGALTPNERQNLPGDVTRTVRSPDWVLTASSTSVDARTNHCLPDDSRLYTKIAASWCAKHKSTSEWLQVDMGLPAQITGVMTQGRGNGKDWVTSFKVSTSVDGSRYTYIKDTYGNQKIFEGNSNSYTIKHNYFDSVIKARFVKFHVNTWHKSPTLRVDIVGCQACRSLLAIPPYARISASSAKGRKKMKTCTEEYGHVLSGKAWCANKTDNKPWLQFDIGPPTLITGVVTLGRGDTKKRHWVTQYRISYSNDSRVWFFYKTEADADPKVFRGNFDKETPRLHFLNMPVKARFIRFHPIKWRGKISMRAGLYGCRHTGSCGNGYFRINNKSACVANLAFEKHAWMSQEDSSVSRHRKRHLPSGRFSRYTETWQQDLAAKAVDGETSKCTVLKQNWGSSSTPAWYVDLKDTVTVSGIVIQTGADTNDSAILNENLLKHLDRLNVYASPYHFLSGYGSGLQVDSLSRDSRIQPYLCSYVSQFRGAPLKSKIHLPCRQPLEARYVYVEAKGRSEDTRGDLMKDFGAVLCEVMVY